MALSSTRFCDLYEPDRLEIQTVRYRNLVSDFVRLFGEPSGIRYISAPGRTELGGNHTDHNHGKVLCAAVHLDTIAAIQVRDDLKIRLHSTAFPDTFTLNLTHLEPAAEEIGTSYSLIRGIAARLKEQGYSIGGFDAVVQSDVLIGSGLSSSASFEVLVGHIFNILFNESSIDPVVLAKAGQFAENHYFLKPCGLMDQLACAVGGVITIDFESTDHPQITTVDVDFTSMEYQLVIVDSGSNHADLTPAYASIPAEMKAVASLFGKKTLREVDEDIFFEQLSFIRSKYGDRPLLRTLHFFRENQRVDEMVAALRENDITTYLGMVDACGDSSSRVLQNAVPPGRDGTDQGIALALGLSNDFFRTKGRGVCRIQGGGFAGTIQAYVHQEDFEEYRTLMSRLFGSDSVQKISVRFSGVIEI